MNDIILEVANLDELKRMAIVVLILWILMIVAVLVDLWTGLEKARSLHEEIHSGGLRRTFTKVGEYWRVLMMLLLVDIIGNIFPWYAFPYASILGTAAVIAIEFRSVIENLRKKHSAAADIPDVIRDIINCKDVERAKQVMKEYFENDQSKAEINGKSRTLDSFNPQMGGRFRE